MTRTALDDPRFYLNRHLEWLEFNRRVLQEARDIGNPLLERVAVLRARAWRLISSCAVSARWCRSCAVSAAGFACGVSLGGFWSTAEFSISKTEGSRISIWEARTGCREIYTNVWKCYFR